MASALLDLDSEKPLTLTEIIENSVERKGKLKAFEGHVSSLYTVGILEYYKRHISGTKQKREQEAADLYDGIAQKLLTETDAATLREFIVNGNETVLINGLIMHAIADEVRERLEKISEPEIDALYRDFTRISFDIMNELGIEMETDRNKLEKTDMPLVVEQISKLNRRYNDVTDSRPLGKRTVTVVEMKDGRSQERKKDVYVGERVVKPEYLHYLVQCGFDNETIRTILHREAHMNAGAAEGVGNQIKAVPTRLYYWNDLETLHLASDDETKEKRIYNGAKAVLDNPTFYFTPFGKIQLKLIKRVRTVRAQGKNPWFSSAVLNWLNRQLSNVGIEEHDPQKPILDRDSYSDQIEATATWKRLFQDDELKPLLLTYQVCVTDAETRTENRKKKKLKREFPEVHQLIGTQLLEAAESSRRSNRLVYEIAESKRFLDSLIETYRDSVRDVTVDNPEIKRRIDRAIRDKDQLEAIRIGADLLPVLHQKEVEEREYKSRFRQLAFADYIERRLLHGLNTYVQELEMYRSSHTYNQAYNILDRVGRTLRRAKEQQAVKKDGTPVDVDEIFSHIVTKIREFANSKDVINKVVGEESLKEQFDRKINAGQYRHSFVGEVETYTDETEMDEQKKIKQRRDPFIEVIASDTILLKQAAGRLYILARNNELLDSNPTAATSDISVNPETRLLEGLLNYNEAITAKLRTISEVLNKAAKKDPTQKLIPSEIEVHPTLSTIADTITHMYTGKKVSFKLEDTTDSELASKITEGCNIYGGIDPLKVVFSTLLNNFAEHAANDDTEDNKVIPISYKTYRGFSDDGSQTYKVDIVVQGVGKKIPDQLRIREGTFVHEISKEIFVDYLNEGREFTTKLGEQGSREGTGLGNLDIRYGIEQVHKQYEGKVRYSIIPSGKYEGRLQATITMNVPEVKLRKAS